MLESVEPENSIYKIKNVFQKIKKYTLDML